MNTFITHTVESAPQAAQAVLKGAQKGLGFIPNLYANMAESPVVLNAYTTLAGKFEKSSFSSTEQQVVLLTASVVNNCEFCVAAHSVIAKQMQKVDADVVNAVRDGNAITDARLEALATFTKAQALEVVLGVTMKTLSNYTNHLTETVVNEDFAAEAWSRS